MNKYSNYMIRQYFLNQLIPPLESHKICGSNFLYDLVNMYIFFKVKPKTQVKSNEDNNDTINEFDLLDQLRAEYANSYKQNRLWLYKFLSYNPTNIILKILVKPVQLYVKIIIEFIIYIYRIFGQKLDI